MGRLTTLIASAASHPDSLPDKLPTISLVDAILPSFISGDSKKKSSSTIWNTSPRSSETIAGVKRSGKDGKLLMVRHRSKPSFMNLEQGSDKNFTVNDIKQKLNDKDKDKSKKDGLGGKAQNMEGCDGRIFTPEEDAKIIANKKANKTWQETANELGKTSKGEVSARYKEITDNAGADGGKNGLVKGNGKDKKGEAKKDECNKKEGNKKDEHNDHKPFTAAEDGKIKEFMEQGLGAQKIALQMPERTKKEIGQRMGELNKAANGQSKPADKHKDGAKADPQKSDNAKKDKSSNRPGNKPGTSGKAPSAAPSAHSEVKFTMSEWITLQEDDEFTFRELQFLSELIGKYPDWSWLQIASRFADKMGRRVHPEDIREKFLQMAAAA